MITPMAPLRNRITGSGEEDPTQLLANPKNWRNHPARQRDALRGSLETVGWVGMVMVNRTTGHLVDGHARVEEAISRGEPSIPVLYVELSPEDEERMVAHRADRERCYSRRHDRPIQYRARRRCARRHATISLPMVLGRATGWCPGDLSINGERSRSHV